MYTAVQRAFLTRCVQHAGKPSNAANDAKCHVESRHDGNGSQFQPANARYVRCKSSNATDDAEPATSSGLAFIFCDYFYEPRGSNTHPLSPIAVHDESANTTSRWPAGFSPPALVLFFCFVVTRGQMAGLGINPMQGMGVNPMASMGQFAGQQQLPPQLAALAPTRQNLEQQVRRAHFTWAWVIK